MIIPIPDFPVHFELDRASGTTQNKARIDVFILDSMTLWSMSSQFFHDLQWNLDKIPAKFSVKIKIKNSSAYWSVWNLRGKTTKTKDFSLKVDKSHNLLTLLGSTPIQTALSWASDSLHFPHIILRMSSGQCTNSRTKTSSGKFFRWCSRKCQAKSRLYMFLKVQSAHWNKYFWWWFS